MYATWTLRVDVHVSRDQYEGRLDRGQWAISIIASCWLVGRKSDSNSERAEEPETRYVPLLLCVGAKMNNL